MASAIKIYAYTALSAALAAAAFLQPRYCALFAFVFLIPIFSVVLRTARKQSASFFFVCGLLWGAVFFGLTLFGFFVLLHESAHGHLRHCLYGVLVAYLSLYSGMWFYTLHKIMEQVRRWYAQCALLVAATTIFFLIVDRYALFILGSAQGYPLANPLLPLVEYPLLLAAIPYCGEVFLLISLITIQVACAMRRNIYVLVFALPFVVGIFLPVRNELPEDLHYLGYICPPQGEHEYPQDVAQEITHALYDLRQRHEYVKVIIMPESSCKFALNDHPRILAAWRDAVLHDDCSLIIGSHRSEDENLFNCLYYLNHGLIINYYDKLYCLPLGEYLPSWLNVPLIKQLFLNKRKKFSCGRSKKVFELTSHLSCEPCICSEFYVRSSTTYVKLPLLVVSNDSWFSKTPYMQYLLLLLVRYRALAEQRPIIYCAHSGGWWLTPQGGMIGLNS